MNTEAIDWKALARLRTAFLSGTAGTADYWQTEADLASYDATFAQRIGWKWDYVLAELSRRGWSPPRGELLDWGCGSGIAGRAFLDHFGAASVSRLKLWDRSPLAIQFAAARARQKYPKLAVATGITQCPDILLISHVLTELAPESCKALTDLAARATSVIWVEPGTYETSRSLIAVRERLCDRFNVVAPCTHQANCGMLTPRNDRHWCHHFAAPPAGVFTDSDWGKFAKWMGIDLRDLPLSFLVLDKRPAPPLPTGATRVIGHARVYKAHAQLLGCDASGVRERKLVRRALPAEFNQWRKGEGDVLQVWRCNGEEIAEARRLTVPGGAGASTESPLKPSEG